MFESQGYSEEAKDAKLNAAVVGKTVANGMLKGRTIRFVFLLI